MCARSPDDTSSFSRVSFAGMQSNRASFGCSAVKTNSRWHAATGPPESARQRSRSNSRAGTSHQTGFHELVASLLSHL